MTRGARPGGVVAVVIVIAALTVSLLVTPAPGPVAAAVRAVPSATADGVRVGTVTLQRCAVLPRALCGRVARPWDPTGAVPGSLSVGFAFVPARDRGHRALGTVVPHEGGPGYATTGSASLYRQMYGPLLRRRNLLLVDQRGTGRSGPIRCTGLQYPNGPFEYAPRAAACARSLGPRAGLYGTALSADDLAAVIRALRLGRVDLYGDSYGTFFGAVFAGRHGDLLRSVVLDSAYPPTGETAWYPTQGPAMLRAIDVVCARAPSCRAAGPATSTLLARVLREVRRSPYRGSAADADGRLRRVTVDAKALVSVVFGATYGPAVYRELPGALRAALHGHRAPLLRLTAEALYGGAGGAPRDYSEGLDAAVSCHDYPQLYDMTAPPAARKAQYAAAVRAQRRSDPQLYAPFTIGEYLDSDWQLADWCLQWPVAPAGHPAGPPAPPSGAYPDVPTLVMSGELDSITTAAEGAQVAAQFPVARQVVVANSFHVTAMGDTDDCAVRVVRSFVVRPRGGLTAPVLSCVNQVPPVRAVATYGRSVREVTPATGRAASTGALRAASGAVGTAADLIDRWFGNYTGHGRGLHGGRWSYAGDRVVRFRLRAVRLTADLPVTGRVTWSRYGSRVRADLTVGGTAPGTVHATWDSRAAGARATIRGRLAGAPVLATMPAP